LVSGVGEFHRFKRQRGHTFKTGFYGGHSKLQSQPSEEEIKHQINCSERRKQNLKISVILNLSTLKKKVRKHAVGQTCMRMTAQPLPKS
jgi:hypothetical protein